MPTTLITYVKQAISLSTVRTDRESNSSRSFERITGIWGPGINLGAPYPGTFQSTGAALSGEGKGLSRSSSCEESPMGSSWKLLAPNQLGLPVRAKLLF